MSERSRGFAVCVGAYTAAAIAAAVTGAALHASHPIVVAGVADVVATVVVFAFSRLFDNSSIYDPYWSVAPLAILPYFALGPWARSGNDLRIVATAIVVATWGVRLTYNWARRWDGLAHEDFRYVDLRKKHGHLYWLVSFAGIHMFPTVLVFLGCVPLYYAATGPSPLGFVDALGVVIALTATWIEARADAELRAFSARPREPGAILKDGLWRTSRHPNYFGEILFWWGMFALGVAGGGGTMWTAAGAAAITLLFNFISVPLMDARMLEKRPHYAEHIKTTNAIIPSFARKS